MDSLKNLNPQQKEAVLASRGPILIIAGAGSGKTRALTHRAAYLIYKGVPPDNILAVTFTNKAADEMKGRILKLLKNEGFSIESSSLKYVGTFHSIALKILKETLKSKFVIFDEDDQLALVKKAIKDLSLSPKLFKPRSTLEAISRAKSELKDVETYEAETKNFWQSQVAKVFRHYQKSLNDHRALDFDDILLKTIKLFRNKKGVLEKYQNHFNHILVDEYQDTNTAQYVFIQALASKEKRLCVVGDVDQAIYGWRGADFRNILNFERDWPSAKVIRLEENYRSTQNVLEAANNLIRQNLLRKEKNLWTRNEEGEPIQVVALPGAEEEATFIAQELLNLKSKLGLKLNDFAVLFRTSAQSRLLEEAFIKMEIPYQLVGGVKFYQRREIKDVLAYLKIIQNPYDLLSLKRIANVPPRGLGKLTQKELVFLQNLILKGASSALGAPKKSSKLADFARFLAKFKSLAKKTNVSGLIKQIIAETDYFGWLDERTEEGQMRADNVRELVTLAANFDYLKNEGLAEFLERVSLMQEADEIGRKPIKNSKLERALLMTVHAAKGLEFPVIFMTGMEENLFPHAKNLEGENLEEERRLAYVALTRAQKIACLTFARHRKIFGSFTVNAPSRFLLEIPENLIAFREMETEEALETIDYD